MALSYWQTGGCQWVTAAASAPVPSDKATDVVRDAVLSWTSGDFAKTHDVYFGTAFDDVNTASRTSAKGVLVSQGQDANTCNPAGLLDFGQTYYWRVDEVNASPDTTLFKGGVWSFTAEMYGFPVKPVEATASSSLTSAMGPDKTIDGSGLDSLDQHGTPSSQMWLSKKNVSPIWIQYEFDAVYKLYQLWVWNSNQQVEQSVGFGAKDVTVETSLDGATWTAVPNVPQFAQASGDASYVHNTTVDFGGAQAKYVKLTIATNTVPKDLGKTNQNWLGRSQYTADAYFTGTLEEFRIYNRALTGGEIRYLAGDR